MATPDNLKEPVLIEWNEEKQTLHFNASKASKPGPGSMPILACRSGNEAMLVTRFLEDVVLKKLSRGYRASGSDMKFCAERLAVFAEQMARQALKEWPLVPVK